VNGTERQNTLLMVLQLYCGPQQRGRGDRRLPRGVGGSTRFIRNELAALTSGSEYPRIGTKLQSGEAFWPKTTDPTSLGSALHLAHPSPLHAMWAGEGQGESSHKATISLNTLGQKACRREDHGPFLSARSG
jgi:hypothetical protein